MKYTIEKVGARWVASNGRDHIEADDPDEALYLLLGGEIGTAHGGGSVDDEVTDTRTADLVDSICRHCLCLIRLLAISGVSQVPTEILQNEVRLITERMAEFLALTEGA